MTASRILAKSITHIDARLVRYRDEAEGLCEIDLSECRGRMAELFNTSVEDCRYVGFRKLDGPPWLVRLQSDPPATLEFETFEEAYERLLDPLSHHGFSTFDVT